MEGLGYLFFAFGLCPVAIVIGLVVYVIVFLGGKYLIKRSLGNDWVRIAAPIGLLSSVVIACAAFYQMFAPAFPAWHMPQHQPMTHDVVGLWSATPDTLQFLAEKGYGSADPTITFSPDGRFQATDIPDLAVFHNNHILYSGNGTWRVTRQYQGEWSIELYFTAIEPPWRPDPPLSGRTTCPGSSVPCDGLRMVLSMWNRDPPYLISINIGGDLSPNIDFRRPSDGQENGS